MAIEAIIRELEMEEARTRGLGRISSLFQGREKQVVGNSAFILFLFIWEILAQNDFLINPVFTSYPSQVFLKLYHMLFVSKELYIHLLASAKVFVIGFLLAEFVGIATGMLMGRKKLLDYVGSPFVDLFYSCPRIAFLPLFVIWMGIGDAPKITLVFLSAVFPVIYNTYQGVRDADPSLIEAARSYGATERDILLKVVLLAAAPFIVAASRLAVGKAIAGVLVAEYFASSVGIGWIIQNSGSTFQISRLFAAVLVISLMGMIGDDGLRFVEKRVAPWRHARQVE
ncbi:MAG: ABC transporter permease [Dehalococcoidia bacterium]|nr:ABC transporter permease [Dehalococcoidia bacterium]